MNKRLKDVIEEDGGCCNDELHKHILAGGRRGIEDVWYMLHKEEV